MKWGRTSKNRKNKNTHKSELSGPLCQVLLTFLGIFVFSLPATVFAAVEITNVMYDPPGSDVGHEWVEVTNKGEGSVDLSTYKFREGGVNHKLTLASGMPTLSAGASAIIASDPATYTSDHPNNTESVFKSSFSLSNTGETLSIVNASGTIESTMSYTAPPKAVSPAPVKKASAKSTATNSSKSSATAAAAPKATSYPSDTSAALGLATQIPPMVGWGAALAAILALGTAGALYARGQSAASMRAAAPEPGKEFEIVEG